MVVVFAAVVVLRGGREAARGRRAEAPCWLPLWSGERRALRLRPQDGVASYIFY